MVTKGIILLWVAVCVDLIVIQAITFGLRSAGLRLKAGSERKITKANNLMISDKGRGVSIKSNAWRTTNSSLLNLKSTKRTLIQRKIKVRGAPKGVIVNVNGQRVYSSVAMSRDPESMRDFLESDKALNLNVKLKKKPSKFEQPQRKQQPVIIAPRLTQQPVRPIVISVPQKTQGFPQQPVGMPASITSPVVLQASPSQSASAPVDKEENDVASILQTVALLKSLGKKEEPPPKIIPVPVPVPSYPAQRFPAGGPYQGYPANENQGYPSQGYPPGGSSNQGYPSGGNLGYPESPSQGYPAGGGQNAPGTTTNSVNSRGPGASLTMTGSNGIVPLLVPMNCRCGCESRCPDLCHLCKDVDEEIYDSIECCKPVPCPCSNGGASTTQKTVAPQPAPVLPQQSRTPLVPQSQQSSPLPGGTGSIAPQTQPAQASSGPVQPSAPGQTLAQPAPAPVQPPPSGSTPSQPVSAPPLPPLSQINPVPPPSFPPMTSQPAPPPGLTVPPNGLSPLPLVPPVSPSKPLTTPENPPIGELLPPKPEITGPSAASITPPRPEILPSSTKPSLGPSSSLPRVPGESERPGAASSSSSDPPQRETKSKPSQERTKEQSHSSPTNVDSAYPAPPPPPQVFIIKDNNAPPKDSEDSKSAEALDNLSKTFEEAFTEAYKIESKKDRHHHQSRGAHFRQRPKERNSDTDESNKRQFREQVHDSNSFNSDLDDDGNPLLEQRPQEDSASESTSDFHDEKFANTENEESDELMQSIVDSSGELADKNATSIDDESNNDEITNKSDDDDLDAINTNADDEGGDNNNVEDTYNDNNEDEEDVNVGSENEQRNDFVEPHQGVSHQHLSRQDATRGQKERKTARSHPYRKFRKHPEDKPRRWNYSTLQKSKHSANSTFLKISRKHLASRYRSRSKTMRKSIFLTSHKRSKQRKLTKSNSEHSAEHKGGTEKGTKTDKRLKIHSITRSKSTKSHNIAISHFANLQLKHSKINHRDYSRRRHFHNRNELNKRKRHYTNQHGNYYRQQHGLQYWPKHIGQHTNSSIETTIKQVKNIETSSSGEGSANWTETKWAFVKWKERKKSPHSKHSLKNKNAKKRLKTLRDTLKSFKGTKAKEF